MSEKKWIKKACSIDIGKILVFGILLLLLLSNSVSAAHTFDAKAQYQTTSWSTTNPGTLSFTANSGASVMVLTIFTAGTSYRTEGTPTFNGKSFTSLGRNMYTSTPEGSSEMWYLLLTPADTGSAYTVSVPNAATSRAISFHVSTFKSATGASALDVNLSKNAFGTNPSQSVTTTANGDVIVAGMFSGLSTAPPVTSPGTAIYSSAPTSYKGMSQYYLKANTGTQVLGWTSSTSDDYSMQTAAFKEVVTYSLSGYVTNSNGVAISGATVTAASQTVTTDGSGYYSLLLSDGTYTITASKSGYNSNSISRTVNGGPVPNANISLTLASGKILVATNRFVILDDANTGSFAGTGFSNPPVNAGADNYKSGTSGPRTSITMWAMVLNNDGMPVPNTNVRFTLTKPGTGGQDGTPTDVTTNNNGLANLTTDLNGRNYYGRWKVNATALDFAGETEFIYNWWGCAGASGGCGENHGSRTFGTTSPKSSPYLGGGDSDPGRWSGGHNSACADCHQSYNGEASMSMNTKGTHSTLSCDNADCHAPASSHSNMVIGDCTNCHTSTNTTMKTTLNGIVSNYSTTSKFHDSNVSIPCIICHGPMHNTIKPDPSAGKLGPTEDSHCTTCHTTYEKHNGGVNCTLCHSQDVHSIKVLSQSAGYVNKGSINQGDCTNCHQNSTFLSDLKNAPKAGSYSGSAPQVQKPLNHSTDRNGTKWAIYWTSTKEACQYCHGDNKHDATRLGNALAAVGTDTIGGAIGTGTVCSSCHDSNDNNYAATMALLVPDPVANQPVTNWNVSGTDHASYGTTDADCKTCHGGVLSASPDISEFVHNVDVGKGGTDCIGCHTSTQGPYPGINAASFTQHMNVNNTDGGLTNSDCRTCHYDTSVMSAVQTLTCDNCHNGTGQYQAPIINNHQENGVNISTNVVCSSCHNNSVNMYAYSQNASVGHYGTKTGLIATADCTNCHKNPVNASIWGGAIDPANSGTFPHSISTTPKEDCYACHNSGSDFHNLSLKKPSKSTVTCLDCHKTPTMAPKTIDSSAIASGSHNNSACTDCHAGATESNMNSYSFSSNPAKTCPECHTGAGGAPLVAEHIKNGQDVNISATCATCHSNGGMFLTNSGTNGSSSAITHYIKDVTNMASLPYQHSGTINTSDCIVCHNGAYTNNSSWGTPVNISKSSKREHSETTTAQCDTCHKDNTVTSLAQVDFHNASLQAADMTNCLGCHTSTQGPYPGINAAFFTKHQDVNKTTGTGILDNADCRTCHYDTSVMSAVQTLTCDNCHNGTGQYQAPIINNHQENGVNISTNVVCSSCHNNSVNMYAYSQNASVGHYGTKTGLIATADCTNCHKNPVNASIWGGATDPANSSTFPHSISNTPKEDCYVCHNSASDFHNLSLKKPSKSTVTCLDCHKTPTMAPKTIDSSAIASGSHNNSECTDCHAGATESNMNSYSFSSNPAKTCPECHTGAGGAPLVAEHIKNGQDVNISATCATCHSNGGMFLTNSGTNGSSSAITHYIKDVTNTGTMPYLHLGPINTSNCIDCHDGPNTTNPLWGSPVNISNSTRRVHTETQTSQCDQCHNDGTVSSLAEVDFHNASLQGSDMNNCLSCHTTLTSSDLGLHSTLNGTDGAMDNGDCKTCHYGSFPMVKGAVNNSNTYFCAACHTTNGGGPNMSSIKFVEKKHGQAACIDCHVADGIYHQGNPRGSVANLTYVNRFTTANIITTDCADCHGAANLDDAPFNAPGGGTHVSGTCLGGCHVASTHSVNSEYNPAMIPSISVPSLNASMVYLGTNVGVTATVSFTGIRAFVDGAQYRIMANSAEILPWTPMSAADGDFYGSSEVAIATIDTGSLTPGTFDIEVRGMAGGPAQNPLMRYYPMNGDVSTSQVTTLTVQPLGGFINGTIKSGDTPLEGALVSTTVASDITGPDGTYSLSVPPGIYDVTASMEPTHDNSITPIVEVTSLNTSYANMTLVLRPTGTISGTVQNV